MGIVYNKLVRDRIPEIIEASGRTCATRILPEGEYLLMLEAKLDEELAEFHKDRTLMEVIRAIAVARGCPPEELERIRAGKADARGGFAGRIFLEEVSE